MDCECTECLITRITELEAELAECEKRLFSSQAREENNEKHIKGLNNTKSWQQNRINELAEELAECQQQRDGLAEALEKCVRVLKQCAVSIGCDPDHGLSEKWWPSIEQAQAALASVQDE